MKLYAYIIFIQKDYKITLLKIEMQPQSNKKKKEKYHKMDFSDS